MTTTPSANPFVQWDPANVKNGATLLRLENVDGAYALDDGESFADRFPLNAQFRFDPDFKRDTVPTDCLPNKEGQLVCNERVRDFVLAREPDKLECLPVTVLDHKDKPVGQPYFILHPIDPPDCIDMAQSRVEMSDFDDDEIWEAEHLVIDAARVPAGRLIFRPKRYNGVILLRRELAEALVAAGFSGAGWKEIA